MSEDMWDEAAKKCQELMLTTLKINEARVKGEPVPHDLILYRYQLINELSAIAAGIKSKQ